MDAICFALGFDIKQLRVSKLDDLLTTRGDEKEPYAFVQLIFSNYHPNGEDSSRKERLDKGEEDDFMKDDDVVVDDDENLKEPHSSLCSSSKTTTSSSSLEEEHSTQSTTTLQHELSVTIFKDKNARKYKLDGKHVSLREVQNFLFRNGLRNCANYVILQNQVIALSFKDPKKLAEMITDESGGLNFQQKVEKALHDLELWKGTENHIMQQIDRLKKVIEEDLKKIQLVQEKQSVETDLRYARIAVKLSKKTRLGKNVATKLEDQANIRQQAASMQNELSKILSTVDKFNIDQDDRTRQACEECLAELELLEKNRQDLEFNVDLIQEEISQLEEKQKKMLEAYEQQLHLEEKRKNEMSSRQQMLTIMDARITVITTMMKR